MQAASRYEAGFQTSTMERFSASSFRIALRTNSESVYRTENAECGCLAPISAKDHWLGVLWSCHAILNYRREKPRFRYHPCLFACCRNAVCILGLTRYQPAFVTIVPWAIDGSHSPSERSSWDQKRDSLD